MSREGGPELSTHHPALITLTGVAHGGEAVGRVGDVVAFVGLGLPGERVAAEVVERKPRFVRARVTEVLDASPRRVTAPCPIFGTCGGCHWQHAAYPAQLDFKTQVLRDQLERIGKFSDPPVGEAVASPLEWHYRNTVQLVPGALDREEAVVPSWVGPATAGRLLCFQRAHSHDLVPVEHCYISDELINRTLAAGAWGELDSRAWAALRSIQVRVAPERAVQITLAHAQRLDRAALRRFVEATRRALPALAGVLTADARGGTAAPVWGDVGLSYRVAGYDLRVPADAFVQVNLGAAEGLVECVLNGLEPRASDTVLDAYAGTGTFTLPLAAQAAAVVALESHRAAAHANAGNAARAGLANVAVQPVPAEQGVGRLHGGVDLVVLDPPRRGCSAEVLDGVVRLAPRRVAYASCEPSTLARDLRRLADAGYRLLESRVVDLFPQTYHLESVSVLERG